MPELPEVETVARGLRQPLVGRTFTGARFLWARTAAMPTPELFNARLADSRIEGVSRRGKYILIELSSPDTLLIHLKMSGQLAVLPNGETTHHHVRAIFTLDNENELRFKDQRKFGKAYLTDSLDVVLGKLGPEPLADGFTIGQFAALLMGRSGRIKPLLLNQHFVAGIGNIYADEALFDAGIHPVRSANTLTKKEIGRLHAGIQKALWRGIEKQGATIGLYRQPDGEKGQMQNEFKIYDRTGEPCYNCGQPIDKIKVGGRGTHYCRHCQR